MVTLVTFGKRKRFWIFSTTHTVSLLLRIRKYDNLDREKYKLSKNTNTTETGHFWEEKVVLDLLHHSHCLTSSQRLFTKDLHDESTAKLSAQNSEIFPIRLNISVKRSIDR